MTTQPEALRLANILEKMPLGQCDEQAAAELRRLHEMNQELLEVLKFIAGHDLTETSDRAKGLIADFIVNRAQKAVSKATGEQA